MLNPPRRARPALVFVYNADSGLFNTLADAAHKIFSPRTYPCNLCALTHAAVGMRGEWRRFLEGLGRPLEFLHADELETRYGAAGVPRRACRGGRAAAGNFSEGGPERRGAGRSRLNKRLPDDGRPEAPGS